MVGQSDWLPITIATGGADFALLIGDFVAECKRPILVAVRRFPTRDDGVGMKTLYWNDLDELLPRSL